MGSTRVVFDSSGGVYSYSSYEPFGKAVDGVGSNDRLSFIGKEQDTESDLGDFGVRKYDSEVGRFLSTDVMWEKFRAYTPYNYCGNNPILIKDPDGKWWPLAAVVIGMLFTETEVANAPRNKYEAANGKEIGMRDVRHFQAVAAVSTGVTTVAKVSVKMVAKATTTTIKQSVKNNSDDLLKQVLSGEKRSAEAQAKSYAKAVDRYTNEFSKGGAKGLMKDLKSHEKTIATHLAKIADPNNKYKSQMEATVRTATQHINAIKQVLTTNGIKPK